MKSNIELVDAAAKAGIAAGMRLFRRRAPGAKAPTDWTMFVPSSLGTPALMPWEPLECNVDACSLIVALPLGVEFEDNTVYIEYQGRLIWEAVYSGDADRAQVTRRAVVLAVASLEELEKPAGTKGPTRPIP